MNIVIATIILLIYTLVMIKIGGSIPPSLSASVDAIGIPAISKYIIRSTGEEVEVIDSEIFSRGERSDNDWVTYIDSKGVEHIKEHLNLQLDFKYGKDFETPKFESMKFPSTENSRSFETAKELLVHKNMSLEDAISLGKELAEAFKEND